MTSPKPLAGRRVLDLTNVLAGPFCCHQLAHLGAEVIKVEVPGTGDLARQLGADKDLNEALMGVSFLAQNAGKRSITLNLKSEDGKAVFRRLVAGADVLVENFRPGVMQRLGLGFEMLKQSRPDLVYCAISGFGQDGPMRDLPAYDQIIQGMSGVMSITGAPDTAPYRVGFPVADTIGGLTAAMAISAALAEKDRTEPRFIDVAMLESVLATMGWAVSNFLIAGRPPQPLGNDNVTASPSGTFETRNGLLNIAANKQEQFEAACRILDRAALISDPRFATRSARLENRVALAALMTEAFMQDDAVSWEARLNEAGVPAGRVLSVPEVLAVPQVAGRGLVETFEKVSGVGRDVSIVVPGVKIDGEAPRVDAPPPELGAQTDEILAELGYSSGEVARLKDSGAV
ncbi:CaiB/BaiF CoA transferase family protein [Nisaea nitritireducens]|uniref:CaiB/BaiF CoA transferase family protein n=1 Tax=Nisaea nitritireducens TaxID=568392 RepID=UPI001867BA8D|nr:CaiB/BaiF CoA-transferase family protein [Nisaea nitritireducens]